MIYGPHDTIRDAILTCAQKLTYVSLICRTEPTTKKWEKGKKLKGKTYMLRSIGKQSEESVESVLPLKYFWWDWGRAFRPYRPSYCSSVRSALCGRTMRCSIR